MLPAIGREIHIPDPLVAGIFSLSALLWTLSAPVWARLSDQYGRKPMILIGLGGFVVSMTGCAFVVLAGLRHLIGPMVVFAGFASLRAIFGLIGSASNPAGQAYVAERTNASERTDALATLAGAFGVGTVLGPAIAPFFVLPFVRFSGPMFGFAGAALVCLFLVVQGLPPETGRPALSFGRGVPLSRRGWRKASTSRSIWLDPRVSPFLLYGFLVGSAQAVNGYTLGFLVIDKVKMSPALAQNFIQVAMMAGAVAGLMAQWGLIRIFRMKPNHLLLWGGGPRRFRQFVDCLGAHLWGHGQRLCLDQYWLWLCPSRLFSRRVLRRFNRGTGPGCRCRHRRQWLVRHHHAHSRGLAI